MRVSQPAGALHELQRDPGMIMGRRRSAKGRLHFLDIAPQDR